MDDKGKTTSNPNMHATILLVIGIILFILGILIVVCSWCSSSRFRCRYHRNNSGYCAADYCLFEISFQASQMSLLA